MDAKTSGPDLLGDTDAATEQAAKLISKTEQHPLHILQQEIAAMPAIDQAKVELALQKIQNGTLGILGTESERLASEQRIAAKIVEESVLAMVDASEIKAND